jgi:hypothetical protein
VVFEEGSVVLGRLIFVLAATFLRSSVEDETLGVGLLLVVLAAELP